MEFSCESVGFTWAWTLWNLWIVQRCLSALRPGSHTLTVRLTSLPCFCGWFLSSLGYGTSIILMLSLNFTLWDGSLHLSKIRILPVPTCGPPDLGGSVLSQHLFSPPPHSSPLSKDASKVVTSQPLGILSDKWFSVSLKSLFSILNFPPGSYDLLYNVLCRQEEKNVFGAYTYWWLWWQCSQWHHQSHKGGSRPSDAKQGSSHPPIFWASLFLGPGIKCTLEPLCPWLKGWDLSLLTAVSLSSILFICNCLRWQVVMSTRWRA